MGVFDALVTPLDEVITSIHNQWNGYSTAVATLIIIAVTYNVMSGRDPDTYPGLLARQASPSQVRQEGESAIYRSRYVPEGMPLVTGLNVKELGASKWSRGKDGDLRDIWKRVISGSPEENGLAGKKGRILTVLGSENVIDHDTDGLTRQLNLIGTHISRQGGNRVAIYLPNSVELIVALFACTFYDLTPIILPFNQPENHILDMLRSSMADTVVTIPGCFPLDSIFRAFPSLRQIIWVVDRGNKHLDWNEVPKGTGGTVDIATWSDILADNPPTAGTELLQISTTPPKDIVMFWSKKSGEIEEMDTFTHSNIVSGIAGQLSAIPTANRLSPADLFLPADSLANIHTLVLTLTALFSNSSVAFNSVAEGSEDLILAAQGVAPTVIVATPLMLLKFHEEMSQKVASFIPKIIHRLQTRSLTKLGYMPDSSLNDSLRPVIGTTPGRLRLIFTADRAGAGTKALSSRVLSDLRVFLGARVVYALSGSGVAGAVTQTNMHDYRVQEDDTYSHFGSPLVCTEILLRDMGYHMTTDDKAEGEIVVRGPCVSGGETSLGVAGTIRRDNTLSYVEHTT